MYFSDNVLAELREAHGGIAVKKQKLVEAYLTRQYRTDRAQEYARHGFSRRLNTMTHCIDRVFEILPPERTDLPTSVERIDAEVHIQAFVFNAYGSADNLAWIWVEQKDVRKEDGSELPSNWVGLRENNTHVRRTFSAGFQNYLDSLNKWFINLEDFRHSLAHRIPLYIPPYVVQKSNADAYNELAKRMGEAFGSLDFEEYDSLSAQQKELAHFIPCMTHSLTEQADSVVFHAQLLADFATIEELGRRMLVEIDS